MSKAYKDSDFMRARAARPLRILAEYLEPHERLKGSQVNRCLIFFGSARIRAGKPGEVANDVDYYAQARDLAARLARWTTDTHTERERYYICTGGGPGIMEAANRGAADENPDLSMGYNISLPHEQGANPYVSAQLNFEFHYFFMRKFWFIYLAHGLIVFPGGFGTMDELFEVLTLIQTKKQAPIPVVLFGGEFWKRLINFDVFVEMGLISKADLELFHFADTVDDAFEFICSALANDTAHFSDHQFPEQ